MTTCTHDMLRRVGSQGKRTGCGFYACVMCKQFLVTEPAAIPFEAIKPAPAMGEFELGGRP